jgi:hypothetical protein
MKMAAGGIFDDEILINCKPNRNPAHQSPGFLFYTATKQNENIQHNNYF